MKQLITNGGIIGKKTRYENGESGVWSVKSLYENARYSVAQTPNYTTGLTDSLDSISGQSASWSNRNVDISEYAGATVRLVFRYISGSSYTGDIQLDNINLDGNAYSFENTGESFQTSTSNISSYGSVSWSSLSTGTTAARWNVDSGGTQATAQD